MVKYGGTFYLRHSALIPAAYNKRKKKLPLETKNTLQIKKWESSQLDTSSEVSSQLAFLFRRKVQTVFFNMAARATILDFHSD